LSSSTECGAFAVYFQFLVDMALTKGQVLALNNIARDWSS